MTENDIARLLARKLEESGQNPSGPVSVAELHRVLLPYHECRNALGFTSKAEYDLAFLRLLDSGRHVRIDGDLASAVGKELSAPEPGLGFLKNFAAAQLHMVADTDVEDDTAEEVGRSLSEGPVSEEAVSEDADARDPSPPDRPEAQTLAASGRHPHAENGQEGGEGAPGEPGGRHLRIEPALEIDESDEIPIAAGSPTREVPESEETDVSLDIGYAAGESEEDCRRCGLALPDREGLRFCPHCGADQTIRECAECEDELEPVWSFCPRCGTAVAPA